MQFELQRLLAHGGFLYFSKEREFISASALTIGSAFSFNGPHHLSNRTSRALESAQRWQPVTIDELVPLRYVDRAGKQASVEAMEFSFVFPNEFARWEPALARHNLHGGFAYRVAVKDVKDVKGSAAARRRDEESGDWPTANSGAIMFTLASVSDAFLS